MDLGAFLTSSMTQAWFSTLSSQLSLVAQAGDLSYLGDRHFGNGES